MAEGGQATGTERALPPLQGAALALLDRDRGWRSTLAALVGADPHDVVLDMGCGAGALTVAIARAAPRAEVIGVDARADLVAQARERALAAGADAAFVACDPAEAAAALGARTPTKIVLSLTGTRTPAERLERLHAARAIIDPGGLLFAADFAATQSPLLRRFSTAVRGDGADTPALVRAAGFVGVEQIASRVTVAGAVALWRARAS